MSESHSQNFPVLIVVHVVNASQLGPWTVTMLVESQRRFEDCSDTCSSILSFLSCLSDKSIPLQQPPSPLVSCRTKPQTCVREPGVYPAK